jgi:hypothetical protein
MADEPVTTTAAAPNNPTPAGAMTPADGSPARTGVIADNAYERLPDADRSKYSRVRAGPEGGSEWRLREIVERESAAATKQPDGSAGDPTATKPATGDTSAPTLVPGDKYKFGDLELTGQEISDLLKHKGETDLRRAAVPADPSGYRIEAKDAVLPPGVEWRFNEADPALAAARTWAHTNGLSQDQFSSLLGQYASMEAAKEATFRSAMKRELDALGANATLRVTALETWLNGVVGADLAKHMRQGMFSAKIVEGLEVIAKKFATQGHASFTQHGREPETGGNGGPLSRLSDADYEAMPASERFRMSRLGG